jgi:hypothetical protein
VANLHKLCPSLRIVHCVVTGGSRDPGGCFFSWDGKSWIKGYHLGTISMWDVGISEIMPYSQRAITSNHLYVLTDGYLQMIRFVWPYLTRLSKLFAGAGVRCYIVETGHRIARSPVTLSSI